MDSKLASRMRMPEKGFETAEGPLQLAVYASARGGWGAL